MRKGLHWGVTAMLVAAALGFAACGNDEEALPKGNGGGSVPDPEGTVIVQVRNDGNGYTQVRPAGYGSYSDRYGGYSGSFYIDGANNLLSSGEVVSVGKVAGLGNVRNRPEQGWAGKSAVLPGYGYILRSSSEKNQNGEPTRDGYTYCRVYVVDYITAVGGGILGATIKYQSPFIPANLPAKKPDEGSGEGSGGLEDYVLE